MTKHPYRPGQVVWAKVPDRRGNVKDQPRPVLILVTHPTDSNAPLGGIAISTRTNDDADDPVVEIPWDPVTGGGTGLSKQCAAVLLWFVMIEPSAIEQISGSVSPEFLAKIERAVQNARLRQMQRQHRKNR